MASLNGFDATQVEPSQVFEPLPAGKYLAVVNASELKPTKNNNGKYLQLTFQILDGPFKGRFVWARLNLENTNPTTVQIARSQLSALCRAVKVLRPRDSSELHNLPVLITVKRKAPRDGGEVSNEITGFEPKDALTGQPQQASTRPDGGATPPWRR